MGVNQTREAVVPRKKILLNETQYTRAHFSVAPAPSRSDLESNLPRNEMAKRNKYRVIAYGPSQRDDTILNTTIGGSQFLDHEINPRQDQTF